MKYAIPHCLAATLAAALALPGFAEDEILLHFDFEDENPASIDTSDYSGESTFDISNAGESAAIQTLGSRTFRSIAATAIGSEVSDSADADAEDATYFTFTLTVDGLADGTQLKLTALTYNYGSTIPLNFQSHVFSDLTGFEEGDALGGVDIGKGNFDATDYVEADLTTQDALSALTNGQEIEFRILVSDTSDSEGRTHVVDEVILLGEVVDGAAAGAAEPG